ncbi:pH-response regulator palC [Gossypium arboreum]|uniref:pH-response regulator palC n=1 Tax=Gossypium arboreum TaxID=29729 RepID=A0A0B0MLI1_GOSAR|nr:pH-response regulator palC [Gossypium arboreum]
MEARIEKLEAKMREVAALEISLYSALSLYMQPPVEGSCADKAIGKLLDPASGDKQPGSFLINLQKMALEDAFQLICPVRAGPICVVACQLLFQGSPEFQPEILASDPKLN